MKANAGGGVKPAEDECLWDTIFNRKHKSQRKKQSVRGQCNWKARKNTALKYSRNVKRRSETRKKAAFHITGILFLVQMIPGFGDYLGVSIFWRRADQKRSPSILNALSSKSKHPVEKRSVLQPSTHFSGYRSVTLALKRCMGTVEKLGNHTLTRLLVSLTIFLPGALLLL